MLLSSRTILIDRQPKEGNWNSDLCSLRRYTSNQYMSEFQSSKERAKLNQILPCSLNERTSNLVVKAMSDDAGHDLGSFWKNPVSKERIFFIDSADSEECRLFCWAMDRAFIVGMDSEWKAAFLSNTSRTPRVSIFQIACRIYDYDEEHISEADDQSKEAMVSLEERIGEVFTEGFDVSRGMRNFVPNSEEAKWRRQLFGEVGNGEESRVQELIFLLDLLVLPLSSFGKTLRSVLISVDILKLGFKFKQDLIYLAGTFPSEEAYSCFSMVILPLL